MDEARLIRRRLEALAFPSPADFVQGSPAFVGRVYNGGSMPASLPGQFLVHPLRPGGTEAEGGTGSRTVDTSVGRVVLVVGNQVPAVGDDLLCRLVGGRWVAERHGAGGGGGISVVGCSCLTLPATLNVVWTPPAGGLGYTYDAGSSPYNATLVYGPAPGPNLQALIGNGWYSTASFNDYSSGPGGAYSNNFYYHLACSTTTLASPLIYRVYESYVDAGGSHGAINYGGVVRWVMAGLNKCSPFSGVTPTWSGGLTTGAATLLP